METKVHTKANLDGVPASLSPELLDRLADLVVAKLIAKYQNVLPSKQVVAGSNPVSRSTEMANNL